MEHTFKQEWNLFRICYNLLGVNMPFTLRFKHHFDAAHQLLNYTGSCGQLHGHRWQVEVVIQTEQLVNGMVADFNLLEKLINELDHCNLNDKFNFNPTAENIAKYLKEKIDKETGLVSQVTVWESPQASITYE